MKKLKVGCIVAAIIFSLTGCTQVTSSTSEDLAISEIVKILASDGSDSEKFGCSVSLSSDGKTALVGAKRAGFSGSAYILTYNNSTWTEQKILLPTDASSYDYIGCSVSLSADGSIALVGAYGDDSYTGAAYIFSGTDWSDEKKLTASDGAASDHFGRIVSLSADGSTALIGAQGNDSNKGAVYFYNGTDWGTETKVTASNASMNHYFGIGLSINSDGTTAVVGRNSGDDIYILSGSDWGTETIISSSNSAYQDDFGHSISISSDGKIILVGASEDDDNGSESGSAFIYSGTNWSTETQIKPSDGTANQYFGYRVSLSGDGTRAVIGNHEDDGPGAAYFYSGIDWSTETKITPSDGSEDDRFSYGLAISSDGSTLLIGSYLDDDQGTDSGSAYIYSVE